MPYCSLSGHKFQVLFSHLPTLLVTKNLRDFKAILIQCSYNLLIVKNYSENQAISFWIMRGKLRQSLSLLLVSIFSTQIALGSKVESNIWQERRETMERAKQNERPLKMASLPASL